MRIKRTVIAAMVLGLSMLSCNEMQGPEIELSGPSQLSQEVDFRGSEAYPWNDHAAPFDFLFGNGMDNHFQGKISNGGRLNGFIYITYTGGMASNGYPKAIPGSCSTNPGDCTVGWIVHGIPVRATLVDMNQGGGHDGGHDDGHDGGHDDGHDGGHDDGHTGMSSRGNFRMAVSMGNGGGHGSDTHGGPPQFCIDPADLPVPPGYTFFHWIGELKRGNPEVGKTYEGYLMKLTARERFYLNKRGGWYIKPGIDYESHDNILTDCE